jgi:hypothetical protein
MFYFTTRAGIIVSQSGVELQISLHWVAVHFDRSLMDPPSHDVIPNRFERPVRNLLFARQNISGIKLRHHSH